ncbi:RNA polymerase-associated protein RapA [Marisediminitalea sp.]|uniref:RNA polymerase-associated protein RapA n=1 Tax=Marisediminitalea sp. TaxID=2662268 RepID=UPI0035161ADE
MSSDTQYAIGQRWLSNTETDLGLGAIIRVDFRSIEVLYPATGESRIYTKDNAPLTRLVFTPGETVKSQEGWSMCVDTVSEQQGVLIYQGLREDTKQSVTLAEPNLDHHIRLNQPEKRLFNYQFDHPNWFDVREASLSSQHQHAQSDTIGMVGARIELIPHQLHIASEVGRRHAPRVLLADEVGLGKTIEAALIIHQQIQTGRAGRVLIIVPDTLIHQWLVEMLRRVNLAFAIYDESRCVALEESEEGSNPFDNDQLILCGLNWLTQHPKRQQQIQQTSWDLMVVDEAHHLAWSADAPSEEYQLVEQLAQATPGVLLLTATPDQLGHESHFARLRLLDPARFYDYATFLEEESQYAALADAVAPLIDGEPLTDDAYKALQALAPEIVSQFDDVNDTASRDALLHQLIDCHGTGRLLFRNRRAAIEGFPARQLHSYALPRPNCYPVDAIDSLSSALFPERQPGLTEQWLNEDPRVSWLLEFLPTVKPAKVLLICASAATAQQLAETIRVKTGIRQAVFHEGMSIVDRDKAAHYFADPEDGAQILLCSEIGSEGRNFQFAHHLVLFDLPLTPDLLEQRIGRLDRIGQTQDVQIHVPVIEHSAQAVLLKWYHEGLNAFEQTCPTGGKVYEDVEEMLITACLMPDDSALIDTLVSQSHTLNNELKAKLDAGRDKLLELNAAGVGRVDSLLEQIIARDSAADLPKLAGRLFDSIGIAQEEKGQDCFILRPTESMIGHLPGLDPEGMTVTYRRRTATTLENVHFLTWDHPLIHNAIELVLTDVHGKSSVGFIAEKEQPKGAYFVETLFVLSGKAPAKLQLERFLPPTPIRLCLDVKGQHTELLNQSLRPVGRKIAQQLIQALTPQLQQQLERARDQAHQHANHILQDALQRMQQSLGSEAQRLKDLQKQNPAIRDSEIAFIEQQIAALTDVLQNCDVQLDAVRILVNNP